MKRIVRDRHLTPEEVAEYNKIREAIEEEFPPPYRALPVEGGFVCQKQETYLKDYYAENINPHTFAWINDVEQATIFASKREAVESALLCDGKR